MFACQRNTDESESRKRSFNGDAPIRYGSLNVKLAMTRMVAVSQLYVLPFLRTLKMTSLSEKIENEIVIHCRVYFKLFLYKIQLLGESNLTSKVFTVPWPGICFLSLKNNLSTVRNRQHTHIK